MARNAQATDVALITHAVLTWAINRGGLSRESLAEKLRVNIDQLRAWEKDTYPTFDQARELSKELGIPFGYLYLSQPPDVTLPVADLRGPVPVNRYSRNLEQFINDALVKQDWYRDLLLNSSANPLPFVGRFSVHDDVMDVAADIRNTLGLTQPARKSVRTWEKYLDLMVRRCEAARIIVMRSSVVANDGARKLSKEEAQGLALVDPIAPVLFVHSGDFKAAQIFTLAHELAHVWIGKSAISKPEQGEVAHHVVERFCNKVATEVLVPKREFVTGWRTNEPRDRVQILAKRFWVSPLVIVRRAHELGEISKDEWHLLRNEAIARQEKRKKGRGNYYSNVTTRLGHLLTQSIIAQVSQGTLAFREAGQLLGMRVKNVVAFVERSA